MLAQCLHGSSVTKQLLVSHSSQSCGRLQINLPSSLMSTLDYAFNDDHTRNTERSFPENLGSGSTPLTPKVFISLSIDAISFGSKKEYILYVEKALGSPCGRKQHLTPCCGWVGWEGYFLASELCCGMYSCFSH